MLYFLWTLLNFGLVLLFIVICLRATKIIREKMGLFASLIYVFGLLSFMVNTHGNDTNNSNIRLNKRVYSTEDKIAPNTNQTLIIPLAREVATDVDLVVSFGSDKETNKIMPTESELSITGLVGGHRWKQMMASIDPTEKDKHFKYLIIGILEWNLLGTKIYSQGKTFTGFIDLR